MPLPVISHSVPISLAVYGSLDECLPLPESEALDVARRYKHGQHLESHSLFLPRTSAMRFPALPAGAFIAAFLILIPASWLWRAGHVHTLSLIAWLFVLNIVYGVNSLVWSDDAIERVPIWCDICKRLVLKATGSVPNPLIPQPPSL